LLYFLGIAGQAQAQGAAAMIKLLESGRLPPERQAAVVKLACERGDAAELAYLFEQTLRPEGFGAEARTVALEGLAAAAENRKEKPAGDLSALTALLSPKQTPTVQRQAVRLAGLWGVESLAPALDVLVRSPQTADELRADALRALVRLGEGPVRKTVDGLLAADDARLKSLGVSALADFDLERAAREAAALLAAGDPAFDAPGLMRPFFQRQGAADQLAAALAAVNLRQDAARLALRAVYASGRSDASLVAALSQAAGINAEPVELGGDQLQRLGEEVMANGDATRGELIFRRAEVSCLKCHSVSGAGGDVGPDLSAVGSTSPVDYLLNSVLNPDLSIKELYLTRSFVTSDGKVFQGIVVDRDDQRVLVKDATGQRIAIPVDEIDEEIEGKSLMPKGLPSLLTHEEFLDLVRFLVELGRPGDFAMRSRPTVQRWRVLKNVPDEMLLARPSPDTLGLALSFGGESWQPVYGKVAGWLPLADVPTTPDKPTYLLAELEVSQPGEVQVVIEPAELAADVWVDRAALEPASQGRVRLERGEHSLLLRLPQDIKAPALRVTVERPAGSTGEYSVVGGAR
jgi:putative heme-binding domain-containing protein